jgi:hypothetical protein
MPVTAWAAPAGCARRQRRAGEGDVAFRDASGGTGLMRGRRPMDQGKTTDMRESTKLLIIVLLGCLFGVFVLLPIDELTSYYEYHFQGSYTVWEFISQQLRKSLSLESPTALSANLNGYKG